MYLLKESVGTVMYRFDDATTFDSLVSKLEELHIPIEKQDKRSGEIVVRCLSDSMNMIAWRCWSDKLVFEVKPISEGSTRVTVFAIPNLFRIRVKSDEVKV